MRTDGRAEAQTDMMKIIVAFRNFAKAPENYTLISVVSYTIYYIRIYIYIYIHLFIFNCNLVDTWWQQYSTHLHTNFTQNTENGTYIIIKRKKKGKCWPCPVFSSCTLAFALQLRKKHGKPSVIAIFRGAIHESVHNKACIPLLKIKRSAPL
jgi:hypothetical protein